MHIVHAQLPNVQLRVASHAEKILYLRVLE